MKTTRMIIGIISCVLFVVIIFQSCAVGIGSALQDKGDTSGSSGFVLALCMMIAGIIGIAARKSKGGAITAGCFYVLGGLVGISNVGIYGDLMVWSILSFIFAAVFIVGAVLQKKSKGESDNTPTE